MASFREIREKAGTQAIGQYVANSFVRRRLVDLVQSSARPFFRKDARDPRSRKPPAST